jgi:hypothetical protein
MRCKENRWIEVPPNDVGKNFSVELTASAGNKNRNVY